MGGKKSTVGYWYHLLLHFKLTQGPIDAFLAWRGGDRNAWEGELTSSGEIMINARNLWGGEEKEGGIEGPADIMFGEEDQEPNAYLLSNLGEKLSAERGIVSAVFKGGRYGAFSPYPKDSAFKFRRVLQGWEEDVCWYPEKAEIPYGANILAPDASGWSYQVIPYHADPGNTNLVVPSSGWVIGQSPFWSGGWVWPDSIPGNTDWPVDTILWMRKTISIPSADGLEMLVRAENGCVVFLNGVEFAAVNRENIQVESGVTVTFTVPAGTHVIAIKAFDEHPSLGDTYCSLQIISEMRRVAMNPAHILYDSHTFRHMDGYPVATINDASLRAAADTLYAEGFGLCAEYDPNTTSVEEFQQRICDTIGGNFSLDDSTGEYHLDLLRPDFDLDSLPILTDDDILEFSEEPTILDDAVNSIVVEYFDPETKEARITEPVESLGTIQAFGVNTSTARYPDIPVASLAARVGQRDVNASTTPTRKFDLRLNRVTYALRKGTRVRLQLLKRGIADMVCVIVEVDKGTLKSGAISMKLVQDIYSMPSTSFVVGEPGEDTSPTTVPVPIVLQAALEVPYVELAGRMTTADLTALAPEAGFIAVVAADPARTRNYSLYTQPAGGEYVDRGVGDWCPTALVVEASAFDDTPFTLSSGTGLANVVVGTAALWGSEIVRVDALDVGTGAVQFGRACGDTVPVKHEAGERVWFYDADAYADDTEYVAGETVSATLLTNSSSQRLDISLAAVLTVVMDERQARPYPPAKLLINGESDPESLSGELTAEWAHRDRILQADQLIDSVVSSIGPESGTTYQASWSLNGTLAHFETDIAGSTASYTPEGSGVVRLEVGSIRDGLESWQRQVREFDFISPVPVTVFTAGGSWACPADGDYEILIVGGGGGGGGYFAGGGGGGGQVKVLTKSLTVGSYAVVVGAGGAGGTAAETGTTSNGSNGTSSSFDSDVALGGGGGGGGFTASLTAPSGGWNGGGGAGRKSQPAAAGGGGYAGGAAAAGDTTNQGGGGGGGGSGGAGAVGNQLTSTGVGGIGVTHTLEGVTTIYGSGGGGGIATVAGARAGSSAGGGAGIGGGVSGSSPHAGAAGTANRGGGGGGGGAYGSLYRAGGAGGSGIVVIRGPLPE